MAILVLPKYFYKGLDGTIEGNILIISNCYKIHERQHRLNCGKFQKRSSWKPLEQWAFVQLVTLDIILDITPSDLQVKKSRFQWLEIKVVV